MRLLILLAGFAACTAAIAADATSETTKGAVEGVARTTDAPGTAPAADAGLPAEVGEALRRVSRPEDPYARWDKLDFDNLHRCAVGCGG